MENKNDMFNKAPKNNKQKMFKFNLYWMYGLIFIMLFALYLTNDSSASKELGWTEFQKLAQETYSTGWSSTTKRIWLKQL